MSASGNVALIAHERGERIARSKEFEWFARAGLVARGVVYLIIGFLAVKLAFGDGGKTTDQQGALATIAKQPLGTVMLVLLAIGLAGYATWRLTRAAIGQGRDGDDELKDRIDGLVSGIGYFGLCLTAVKILAGSGGGGGSNPGKTTGGVLGWPGGPWLVGIVGVIIIGVALEQGYKGISRKFMEKADTGRMSESVEKAYTAFGVFGHLARMVVFALMGWFVLKAALDFDPDKAVALDGALSKLANAPHGPLLLGIVAFGLIGFAGYSIVESRYRRI
jgi:Domain of Unknown Function (DUF1206)